MAEKDGGAGKSGPSYEPGEKRLTEAEAEAQIFDIILTEYPGYTIRQIERELTYEQLYMFINIIIERKHRQAKQRKHGASGPERNYDIEDIAEGKVADIGFGVEKKVVQ